MNQSFHVLLIVYTHGFLDNVLFTNTPVDGFHPIIIDEN